MNISVVNHSVDEQFGLASLDALCVLLSEKICGIPREVGHTFFNLPRRDNHISNRSLLHCPSPIDADWQFIANTISPANSTFSAGPYRSF